MNRLLLVCMVCVAACGKDKGKDSPASGSGSGTGATGGSAAPPSVAVDATATGAAAVDATAEDPEAAEVARRKDKKTGLGAPDEKPEVIVEDLVRAIGTGKVEAKRFIDPRRGVVERISMAGGTDKPAPEVKRRLCGNAVKRTTEYIQGMVRAEEGGAPNELHQIWCGNEFIDKDDPELGADEMGDKPGGAVPMKHVTCVAAGAGEYDEIFHVEWVPDAERGFRIAAIVSTEGGANTGMLWHDVAVDVGNKKDCK